MSRNLTLLLIVVFLATPVIFAQTGPGHPKTDVAFWVDHWSRPPVTVFGPE